MSCSDTVVRGDKKLVGFICGRIYDGRRRGLLKAIGWTLVAFNAIGIAGYAMQNPNRMLVLVASVFEAFGMCVLGLIGVLLITTKSRRARSERAREREGSEPPGRASS